MATIDTVGSTITEQDIEEFVRLLEDSEDAPHCEARHLLRDLTPMGPCSHVVTHRYVADCPKQPTQDKLVCQNFVNQAIESDHNHGGVYCWKVIPV